MSGEDGILVLAPMGRDTDVIVTQLSLVGITATTATADAIINAVATGQLGAAIVADSALFGFDLDRLAAAFAAQPPWSDSPFIILTQQKFGGWTRARLAEVLGNVSIYERPFHPDVLVCGVRSALRARSRQRRAQDFLRASEQAEAQVRELNETLEMRVEERTTALTWALVERAEALQQLRESEEMYRHTIQLTAQIPWQAAADGAILGHGAGWTDTPDNSSFDWLTLVHPQEVDSVRSAWATAVATATPFLQDYHQITNEGTYVWCRARAAPLLDADGSVISWYGTLEDIDDREVAANKLRQMQAELIHVSRLSAMGAMASTLAHELNQPLTAIANYVRGCKQLLADEPVLASIKQALDGADQNAVRAGRIVRRVRDHVTKGDVQREPEDLSALINEACELAMVDARSTGIKLRLELTALPIIVLVDRIQIQQVMINLLRNAVEAVGGLSTPKITVTAKLKSGNSCEVTVRDTGPGVAEASIERLFEPFNTTKVDGMGIGLSISRTIIEAHGGTIWSRPAREGGAVFGFTLACTPKAGDAVKTA